MKILFCPPLFLHNTLQEKCAECEIETAFEKSVDNLWFLPNSPQDLFDAIYECQALVLYWHSKPDNIILWCLQVFVKLGRPVYMMDASNHIVKREEQTLALA